MIINFAFRGLFHLKISKHFENIGPCCTPVHHKLRAWQEAQEVVFEVEAPLH